MFGFPPLLWGISAAVFIYINIIYIYILYYISHLVSFPGFPFQHPFVSWTKMLHEGTHLLKSCRNCIEDLQGFKWWPTWNYQRWSPWKHKGGLLAPPKGSCKDRNLPTQSTFRGKLAVSWPVFFWGRVLWLLKKMAEQKHIYILHMLFNEMIRSHGGNLTLRCSSLASQLFSSHFQSRWHIWKTPAAKNSRFSFTGLHDVTCKTLVTAQKRRFTSNNAKILEISIWHVLSMWCKNFQYTLAWWHKINIAR